MASSKKLGTSAPRLIRRSSNTAAAIQPLSTAPRSPSNFGQTTSSSPSTITGVAPDGSAARSAPALTTAAAQQPTHFVCIPLHGPACHSRLQTSLHHFRAQAQTLLLSSNNSTSVHGPGGANTDTSSIFANPEFYAQSIRDAGTLHLTLGVMSLASAEQLSRAVQLLQELDTSALLASCFSASSPCFSSSSSSIATTATAAAAAPGIAGLHMESTPTVAQQQQRRPKEKEGDKGDDAGICVRLQGLRSMQAPHRTTVLYVAPTDASGRLLPLCEAIRGVFVRAGLIRSEKHGFKLHATVMNTVYARNVHGRRANNARGSGGGGGGGGSRARRNPKRQSIEIDATEILAHFASYDWLDPPSSKDSATPIAAEIEAETETAATKNALDGETMLLDRLSICEMGAKFDANAGELQYREIASRPLLGR